MKTTYQVFHGAVNGDFINGPFGLHVRADNDDWKAGKCVATCSNIPTAVLADQRAREYAQSYGATIETPMLSS